VIVQGPDGAWLLPTRSFERHEFIDSGDIVILWIRSADDQSIAVMMPTKAMQEMVATLNEGERPTAPSDQPW
jgi:hypothetical protein